LLQNFDGRKLIGILIDTGSEFLKEEKKLRELLVLSVDLGTYN
jgi:hypothetical protein